MRGDAVKSDSSLPHVVQEAALSFEKSVNVYWTTRSCITEDSNIHSHSQDKLTCTYRSILLC
jgi:hypothetical protein